MSEGTKVIFDLINVLTLIGLHASEEGRDVSPEELREASGRLGAKITALDAKLTAAP